MFDPSKLNLSVEEGNGIKNDEIIESEKTEDNNLEVGNDPLENLENITEKQEPSATLENDENLKYEDILWDLSDQNEEIINEKVDASEIVEENNVWKTEYEKAIAKDIKENKNLANNDNKNIIFDINLTSIEILLNILIDKEYDFATFEPSDEAVKINFRKDKVIKDTKYIKFPVYSNILLKAKALTKLTIEETENEQEWSGNVRIRNKNYKVTTKVVPSDLWPKLFIKTKETVEKIEKKSSSKIPLSKIFTFLWALAFITLIVWGAFIGFVVINAKTVEDIKFFNSLWINLNEINNFLWQTLAFIFSVLIFLETIFLIINLFKFFLTKKEFKQKKIKHWIIAAIILIFTFSTWSAWMIIDQKIRSLPNWQEMAYWEVQIYDNSKLLNESFNKEWALITDTSNLIGPLEIKFDLSYYAKNEDRKWLTIKKYIWDFWDGDIKETPVPTIIHNFKKEWNHEVVLIIEQVDIAWEVTEKKVEWIPNINLSYVVKINEKSLNNWWKIVEFDATTLKELWKIEWYYMDDLNTPKYIWEYFRPGTPIFEDTLVWMYIRVSGKKSEELDKLFIISWESETNLGWKVNYTRSLENDLEFDIWVENLENDFWKWYIEEYKWIIWDKEITNIWDINDPIKSSKIKFNFGSYWDHVVKVILKDSSWETKEIETTIEIPKILKLSLPVKIYNEEVLLENVSYESELNNYYINQIGIPTSLKFDARFIRSNNINYTLSKVNWDYNSDWDIDESAKIWNYKVNVEWNHTITVNYEFVNRKVPDDIIKMKEQIFIEWLKKVAIIDFDIIKNSSYVPVIVSFDWSKSQVKDENIEKFIWDYGDWFIEEKDSIVQWHKYTSPWDYDIVLKVITTSWKEFSVSKKLILKPKPQSVKISTSMKTAPTWQWIDFSSSESEWQIIAYFWDFWDWNTSTEANPTHSYKKEWNYKVTLKLDFANNNILEDVIDVEITER